MHIKINMHAYLIKYANLDYFSELAMLSTVK